MAAGVFAPRRIYRGLALIGCVFFLVAAVVDYQKRIEFRQRLRSILERHTEDYAPLEAEEELSPRREGAKERGVK